MSEHSEQSALFDWADWQANLGVEPLRWIFADKVGTIISKMHRQYLTMYISRYIMIYND